MVEHGDVLKYSQAVKITVDVEHVGTKTAVQIRSHAQKFFCKIKKEASLGASKEAIEDFDIPPARPKRKPIHPYPRKCVAVIPCNDKVPRPKSESKPALLGIPDRDSVSSVPPAVDYDPCQPRGADDDASAVKSHQNLQEMQSEGSQNSDPAIEVAKELQNLSGLVFDGSTKATEGELSPVKEMLPDQPDNRTIDNKNMTSEMSSSNLVAAFQQLIAPLQPFMQCTISSEKSSPFQSSSSATQNLMQNSLSPSQVPNMDGAPALPTLAGPCSSYIPWHLAHAAPFNNPIAFAAAAAAAAAFWPGLTQQPSLHVPSRPSSNLDAQNGLESTNAVAAAAVAAAAAAFANASTWWSLNGAVTNPPVTPKVRSVYKPNPTVHPTTIEGQQTGRSCLPHNPKNQEKDCKPISGEQEDSTVNGSLEDVHSDYPDSQDWTVANSRPSLEHGEDNCTQAKYDMSKETDEKNRITEVLSVTASEGKMKRASSGLATTEDGEEGSSQTGYSSPVEANAPAQWVASIDDEPCGSAHLVKCETSSEQDAFRITFLVTVTGDASQDEKELDMIKQSMSGNTRKLHEENKDLQVNHDTMDRLSGHARKLLEGNNDLQMKHDNMWGQSLQQQETSDEVSYSAGRNKVAENGNLLAAHETADTFSVTRGENHVADTTTSEAASSKHREKLVVTAHSKVWKVAGNKSKLLSSSQKSQLHGEYRDRIRTCKLDQQNLEKEAEGSPFKTQRLCDPVASSSGSGRYSGQGFVPYRRS